MSATQWQSWSFPPVDVDVDGAEEEPILSAEASEPLYKRAEPTRLLRYRHADAPPGEVALSPRSAGRRRGCLTLTHTYQITSSTQDHAGHVLGESTSPSEP